GLDLPILRDQSKPFARVVIVHDPIATLAFEPRPERIVSMVNRGITAWTGKPNPAAAWRSLLTTQDVIGIKVYSAPGPNSGTRPVVAAAVIEGLLESGIHPTNVIVWDKQMENLRSAGFFEL